MGKHGGKHGDRRNIFLNREITHRVNLTVSNDIGIALADDNFKL